MKHGGRKKPGRSGGSVEEDDLELLRSRLQKQESSGGETEIGVSINLAATSRWSQLRRSRRSVRERVPFSKPPKTGRKKKIGREPANGESKASRWF